MGMKHEEKVAEQPPKNEPPKSSETKTVEEVLNQIKEGVTGFVKDTVEGLKVTGVEEFTKNLVDNQNRYLVTLSYRDENLWRDTITEVKTSVRNVQTSRSIDEEGRVREDFEVYKELSVHVTTTYVNKCWRKGIKMLGCVMGILLIVFLVLGGCSLVKRYSMQKTTKEPESTSTPTSPSSKISLMLETSSKICEVFV